MDLKEMINRCKLGEKDAFQELLESVEKEALTTAYFISGNRGIAEDILQETYIRCFKEIKNLKHEDAFKVWFFKILVRTGWEMCKKHSYLVPMDITTEGESNLFNLQNENNIEKYELKLTVHSAVNKLNEKLKTVVILYYFNDMSIEDIAKILGCFKSTIKSRLFYARNQLKKELESCFSYNYDFEKVNNKECDQHA